MKLKELVKNTIPTINLKTTGSMALLIMEEYKISHLIILSDNNFEGILSQDAILEMEDLTKSIGDILNKAQHISLNTINHICIALKTFSEHQLSLIPVFENNQYAGYITTTDIIYQIGKAYQLTEIGILTIECTMEDYSLSEITRIIEENKGSVISSFMQMSTNSKNISVDLIINQKNLTRIIKSLKRFDWNVTETYDNSLVENFDSRFDSFLRYLNT